MENMPASNQNSITGKSSQTYILFTAFLALFAIVGFALYGIPFFYDFMVRDFGFSRAEVTSGNAFGKLVVAPLFGFLSGWLIDRYGPRRLMMIGIVLAGIALAGLSISSSLWLFYFFFVFNALGYVFGGPLPCQVLISRWFDKNRGKAMGIAYIGIGLGGAIVPKLANLLERNAGWQNAMIALGVLIVVIAFPMAFFIKDPAGKNNANTIREKVSVKKVFYNPWFYLLAFGSMCSIGAVGGMVQHQKLFLRDLNFTQEQASNIMSMVLYASIAGRLIMGWLADLINRKYVMILIYCIVAVAIGLLVMPPFEGKIYVFAIVFGIGLGGDYMIIPLMAGDLFGVKVLGRVMGIILVADGIAESVFPVLVGHLYDKSQSYIPGFTVLIIVALVGVLLVSFLPKKSEIKVG